MLPVTIYKNKIYFLFGKENQMEDSAKGFSDFGGGVESGESIMETALREGAEELSGFLGDASQFKSLIKRNGGLYKLSHNDYNIHLFYLEYDENLPKYYKNNHHFLWNKMDKKMLNDSKLFEKQEIDWFSVDDLKKRRHEFRPFYREMVDLFVKNIHHIKRFISTRKSRSKTYKKRSFSDGNSKDGNRENGNRATRNYKKRSGYKRGGIGGMGGIGEMGGMGGMGGRIMGGRIMGGRIMGGMVMGG